MLDAGLCAFNITVRRTNYGWSRQPNFETVEEVENLHKSLVNDMKSCERWNPETQVEGRSRVSDVVPRQQFEGQNRVARSV